MIKLKLKNYSEIKLIIFEHTFSAFSKKRWGKGLLTKMYTWKNKIDGKLSLLH